MTHAPQGGPTHDPLALNGRKGAAAFTPPGTPAKPKPPMGNGAKANPLAEAFAWQEDMRRV